MDSNRVFSRPALRRTMSTLGLAALALGATFPAGAALAGADEEVGPTIRLHLIWSNDVHGHVSPEGARFMNPNFPPPLGGGASASRYVEKVRAECANDPNSDVLLVDAGDCWQGAPVGTLTEGEVMVAYYNHMHYDAIAVGNHEFDKGKDIAIRMSNALRMKFLSSNIYKAGTQELVDWVEPYRVIEKAGLRIGVIGGITPSTAASSFAENVEGLDFGPLLPALSKYRDILLHEEHVDLVVAVIHEGLPYDAEEGWAELIDRVESGEDIRDSVYGAMDLAHVLDGVPVIVGGHTHRGYRDPWIDPVTHTMVFESFGNGSSLGHAILNIDRETGMVLGYDAPQKGRNGVLVTLFEDEWWPEEKMQEGLRPYIEEAEAGLNERVGRASVELTRSGGPLSRMGSFITTAMKEALDADFAFTNNGGLRADLSRGDITVGDLMRVLPFGNALAVIEMDGRTIRRIFERKGGRGSSGISQTGCKVVLDPDAPFGQRVLELTIRDGEPLEADKIYRVVTTDFLMDGNSGLDFLAQIPPDRVDYTGVLTRDAVASYLQEHSPVSPRGDDRWVERSGGEMASYLKGWTLQ